MILHYISTAWRHLMKYKVQNIISVLCLAIGTVCFALTLQMIHRISLIDNADKRIATIEHYRRRDANVGEDARRYHAPDSALIADINRLQLPSIREVAFRAPLLCMDFNFEDGTPLPKTYQCSLTNLSPRWCLLHGMRSAITGDPIPELDEGDVVISDDVRDRVYGRGADPRGRRILDEIDGRVRTIRDVVAISVMDNLPDNNIFYISRTPIADVYLGSLNGLDVEPSVGCDAETVASELNEALPTHEFIHHTSYTSSLDPDNIRDILLFFLSVTAALLIGGSVLLIGVSGYLKMQTQLFSLRSRELALRRTMGARPWQLFMHLAVETVMMFLLAAIVAEGITAVLTPYILRSFQGIGETLAYARDLQLFHDIRWSVLLGTLAVTLGISAWTVRKQLREPVGMRVGRSGHPRTKGQTFMLGAQLVTCMVLLLVTMIGTDTLIENDYELYVVTTPDMDKSPDLSAYRRSLIVDKIQADGIRPGFRHCLDSVSGIDHVSTVIYVMCDTTETDSTRQIPHKEVMHYSNPDTSVLRYSMLASDEDLPKRLGVSISTKPYRHSRWHFASEIYARTEEAERLRRKWNLDSIPDAPVRTTLCGGRSYTLLGYAPCLKGYHRVHQYPVPSYWLIDGEARPEDFPAGSDPNDYKLRADYIIFARDGHYDRVERDVQAILHEARPGNLNPSIARNLYDTWFAKRRLLDMVRRVCILPALISILCIIATVFSAVSLECRGRQKEIALRKVHGAHPRDIMRMMGGYYLRLLGRSAMVTVALAVGFGILQALLTESVIPKLVLMAGTYLVVSILVVSAVTLLTIRHKIRRVSRLKAADIIAKE